MIQYDIVIFHNNMKEFLKKEIIIPSTLSFLLLLGCNGLNNLESAVEFNGNATPVPQEVLLNCRQVQFGDTALGIAYEMGGTANSLISIDGGEKVPAYSAPILLLNEQHGIQPEVCVYEVK